MFSTRTENSSENSENDLETSTLCPITLKFFADLKNSTTVALRCFNLKNSISIVIRIECSLQANLLNEVINAVYFWNCYFCPLPPFWKIALFIYFMLHIFNIYIRALKRNTNAE